MIFKNKKKKERKGEREEFDLVHASIKLSTASFQLQNEVHRLDTSMQSPPVWPEPLSQPPSYYSYHLDILASLTLNPCLTPTPQIIMTSHGWAKSPISMSAAPVYLVRIRSFQGTSVSLPHWFMSPRQTSVGFVLVSLAPLGPAQQPCVALDGNIINCLSYGRNSTGKRYKEGCEQLSRGLQHGLCTYREALLIATSPNPILKGESSRLPLAPMVPLQWAYTHLRPSLCLKFPHLSLRENRMNMFAHSQKWPSPMPPISSLFLPIQPFFLSLHKQGWWGGRTFLPLISKNTNSKGVETKTHVLGLTAVQVMLAVHLLYKDRFILLGHSFTFPRNHKMKTSRPKPQGLHMISLSCKVLKIIFIYSLLQCSAGRTQEPVEVHGTWTEELTITPAITRVDHNAAQIHNWQQLTTLYGQSETQICHLWLTSPYLKCEYL